MNWLVTNKKKQEESQQDMSVYRMLFQVHVWSKHFETSLLLESNMTLHGIYGMHLPGWLTSI